jgi:energy-coupling factor transporter ATP-binding protein EcfA2
MARDFIADKEILEITPSYLKTKDLLYHDKAEYEKTNGGWRLKGTSVTGMEPGKAPEISTREISFFEADGWLYEQVVVNGQAMFIGFKDGETKTVNHVMQGEVRVIPLSSEEITLGAVKLPSGIAEYGDTLSLLKKIEGYIYRYLDVSDSFRKFAAYYILLSWLYDRFNTLPYLRFIGDTGCGKSRALDVCGGLCYKATSASGCITPAPIYRMLKKWAGTIILDEADLQNSDEYHEVTKILNCGFERNRPVIRAIKDNPDRLQILPTFGPKVFATRRRFKDAALEARCLTEIMQETTREDIPATLTSTFYKEQEVLRNKLLLFRLRNYNNINLESTGSLDLHGIEPRLRQISACFEALFTGQADVLSDYKAFISHHQKELIEQRATTTIGQVVEKLISLTESDTLDTLDTLDTTLIPISAGDIAELLNMTPQSVGQILKTLGLQTKFIKGKSKRCIVYDPVKLNTLKRRYIPSEDDDSVTMVSMVSTPRDSIQNNDTGSTDISDYPTPPCYNRGCGDY